MTMTRDELRARHGSGERLPDDIPGEVFVFRHRSQEAAEDYAAANRDHWDHPARAELRESAGWVCVIDLRPAIARVEAGRGVWWP